MARVRITAVRQTVYSDLMKKYENPIQHACNIREGQEWISVDGECPEGMCPSAWGSMQEFVCSLAQGKGNFFDGWMQNPMSAMISCNDGFRPMSFYIELIEEAVVDTEEVVVVKEVAKPLDRAEQRILRLVMAVGEQTMPRRQIIAYLGLKQRSRRNFMTNYLQPDIARVYIVMAKPSSPNSPEQAYRLSADGLDLWAKLKNDSK